METNTMSGDRDTPRKRRWWLWILAPLFCVAVGIGVYVASVRSGLNSLTAELDRLDPGWRFEEIEAARKDYPPEQNAAVKILAIKAKRKQVGNQQYVKLHDVLQGVVDPAKQLNDEQIDAVRKLVDASGDGVAEARMLIDFPNGRHAIVWSPDWISTILKCQDNRETASILRNDAFLCAQNGDADGALLACHAGFHAGCSIGDEPMLISQLVRIACQAVALTSLERVLAQGSPSEAKLEAFQKRLTESEAEPLLLIAFRGERAGQFRLLEHMSEGNVPGGLTAGLVGNGGGGAPKFDYMALLFRVPGFMATQSIGCIKYMNEMVAIAKLPPEEWSAKFAAAGQQIGELPMMVRLLAPAMDKIGQAVQRSHGTQRCAIVAIACERFRKKNDRWPNSLDELKAAGLLATIPTDPYVGGPLKFKRTNDGVLIYVVGPDLKDDGGNCDRMNPMKPGTDLGFELWDLAKRRQPAPPPKPSDDEPVDPPPGAPK